MKSEWLKIISEIQDAEKTECCIFPICGQNQMDFLYIGNEESRIGFLSIWCNSCLKGIRISRVKIPKSMKMLPFTTSSAEVNDRVPNFEEIPI